ncbi:MAG: universal stress protein [Proteobacteria bacterium]|nr:universal stress protein [Pseudomonadota bacterium]
MARIRNILAPTDCSNVSKEAVLIAMELATAFKANLTVLNVTSPPNFIDTVFDTKGVYQQMVEEVMSRAEKRFGEFWESIGLPEVEADLVQKQGDPFSEITRYVDENNQDLIVMGTHGRTGLMHVMMGSVAEKVVRYSPVPVLIVKHENVVYRASSTEHSSSARPPF